MSRIAFAGVFLSVGLTLAAQTTFNQGAIHGKGHIFHLTAPEGWILDKKSGMRQGLYAVFYTKGETWHKGETVMYISNTSLEVAEHKTLAELIAFDLNNLKKDHKDIDILNAPDIDTKSGLRAIVKHISGHYYRNFEAIAYIDTGKKGAIIVLSSRNQTGFYNSLKAFETLVHSYEDLGE